METSNLTINQNGGFNMNKDLLSNFRSNLINGNKKDARKIIKEYGETDFFFDYAQYLESLEFGNNGILFDELSRALAIYKYLS